MIANTELAIVGRLLAEHGCQISSLRPLGSGLDHVTYEVDGEFVVRLSRQTDPAERAREVTVEARLLHRVGEISPLPVPVPNIVDPVHGLSTYLKLPGQPLLHVPAGARAAHAAALGSSLGSFLAVVHNLSPHDAELFPEDTTPPVEWLEEAADNYSRCAAHIGAEHRHAIASFLRADPPPAAQRLTVCHNDLGIEHILVDPRSWAISGIIDWSDAALADPARDLGLVHRDLGPRGLRATLSTYRAAGAGTDLELLARAVFHARCGALEDLAYGLVTGQDDYTANSLAAMAWLLPSTFHGHGSREGTS